MKTQPVGEGNDAVVPPCPHFGVCGGCQLQHLAYSAQLGYKAAKLRELLSGFTLPELQLHASQPLGYRNRIRLTLAQVEGQLRAGYLGDPEEPDTPGRDLNFVPIAQCPIAAPLLWRTAEAFVALAEGAAWLRQPQIVPDQLELFTTADESRLLFTLYLRMAQKTPPARLTAEFAGFCEQLRAQVPELAGAGIAYLPAATRSRRTEQQRPGPAWGAPGLNYVIALPGEDRQSSQAQPLAYWVPRGAFFQVNRLLLPELVALVSRVAAAAGAHDRTLAWDLYAGVGLFSRVLAGSFGQVTAVEIAEPAATALAQMKVPGLRAAKSTTLDFLRTAVVQRERPSLVVVDPPRMGLGAEACSLLTRIAALRLVYVSCSPKALAADLAVLVASGYTIGELHLFDLFPQTEHVETVAVLQRS